MGFLVGDIHHPSLPLKVIKRSILCEPRSSEICHVENSTNRQGRRRGKGSTETGVRAADGPEYERIIVLAALPDARCRYLRCAELVEAYHRLMTEKWVRVQDVLSVYREVLFGPYFPAPPM